LNVFFCKTAVIKPQFALSKDYLKDEINLYSAESKI
jgi:hypothetical protein